MSTIAFVSAIVAGFAYGITPAFAAYPGTAVGGQTARPMAASISLAWLFSSVIRVKVSNIGEQGGKPTILPTSGFCVFGQGVDAGNVIEGEIDTVPTIDGVAPPAQVVTSTAGHAARTTSTSTRGPPGGVSAASAKSTALATVMGTSKWQR